MRRSMMLLLGLGTTVGLLLTGCGNKTPRGSDKPAACRADATCDNGDPCDGAERCVDNRCVAGTAFTCEPPTNPCFAAACINHLGNPVCAQTPTNAAGCVYCLLPSECDDQNPCTDDDCDADGLCAFVADDLNACSDGKSCTADACDDGECVGTPVHTACDDLNPCTDDTCAPATGDATTGCAYADNSDGCNDGLSCTSGDVCGGGVCAGTPVHTACDDSNPCTDDTCDPLTGDVLTGCAYADNSDGCNDGLSCTSGDVCGGGVCAGTPVHTACDDLNPCTDDTCDPLTGAPTTGCAYADNSDGCNDGLSCTNGDVCNAGSCAGTPVHTACDDGDQCTTNLCDPLNGAAVTGCYFPGHTGACDDGDVCTGDDVCDTNGVCAGSVAAMHLRACAGGVLCYGGVCLQQTRTDDTTLPTLTNPANTSETCACTWNAADLYYGAPPAPSTAVGFYALVNHQSCTGCVHPSYPTVPLSDLFGVYEITGPTELTALDGVNIGRGYQIDAGRIVSAGWNFPSGGIDLGAGGMLRCLSPEGTAWRATSCPEPAPVTIGAMTGVGVWNEHVVIIGHDSGSATNAHLRHWDSDAGSWTGDRWVEASNCMGNGTIIRSDVNRSPTGLALAAGMGMPQALIAAQNLAPTGTAFSSRHHNFSTACNNTEYTLYRGDLDDTFLEGAIARSDNEVYLWGQYDDRYDAIVRSLWRCTMGSLHSWSCAEAPVPLPTRNQDRIDYWDATRTPGGDLLFVATLCAGCNPPPCTTPPCLMPNMSSSNRLIALPAGKDGADASSWEIHSLSGGYISPCMVPPCVSRLAKAIAADSTQLYLLGPNATNKVPTIWHLAPP